MAYNEFAYFYDEFNEDANYEALFSYVKKQLNKYGVKNGIVADLGCGTGDLTLMLAQCGYDMIAIDYSEEMLAVLAEKVQQVGVANVLMLRQDLTKLDLYGTVNAAVSTFDTYNHIGPFNRFEKAIADAALFMEKGAVFVFDLNTPYKHKHILADRTFEMETEDAVCIWKNDYDDAEKKSCIHIDIKYYDNDDKTENCFEEEFYEYVYTQQQVCQVCEKYGLKIVEICDGEAFVPLKTDSQRMIVTAIKQYTQNENCNKIVN
ncbi:MAG: class I SAM-dependent methyltransferase [Oscillospiraceae bacterium]|nr:class I SAM-dependent methyltransferase [Oscillospiraceae bacterium]